MLRSSNRWLTTLVLALAVMGATVPMGTQALAQQEEGAAAPAAAPDEGAAAPAAAPDEGAAAPAAAPGEGAAAPATAPDDGTAASAEPATEEPEAVKTLSGELNHTIEWVNSWVAWALFWDAAWGYITIEEVARDGTPVLDDAGKPSIKTIEIPFLIVVLVAGAIFFTFWFRWINVRGLKHSVDVIRGRYDRPEDKGEISHFRALTSALSATVGLGNIAGVAIAIQTGGPGAVFWMWCAAVFGMTAKFSSCTLAQLYRQENPDGSISGGPMYYLDLGLKSKGPLLAILGKFLAVMFAFMVMGGAMGGGNMFQANQSFMAFSETFEIPTDGNAKYIYGIVMAVLVGVVILGGIKRIGAATSKIVPAMCGLYVAASLFIILANIGQVPETFSLIFTMAFTDNAYLGGAFGVLVTGVQRAAFSNEAGLGSAAIAHAAAKTDEPVREGMVAMVGPFIDTIVVCTMTALVVIITGMWENPEIGAGASNPGIALTVAAFKTAIPYSQYVLAVCIILFAYSTMISWCYYGERGWIYLLDHLGKGTGLKSVIVFRVAFVICVFIGSVASLGAVLDFSDLMILCMAFPNIIGSVILAPTVLKICQEYWGRLFSGQMPPVN